MAEEEPAHDRAPFAMRVDCEPQEYDSMAMVQQFTNISPPGTLSSVTGSSFAALTYLYMMFSLLEMLTALAVILSKESSEEGTVVGEGGDGEILTDSGVVETFADSGANFAKKWGIPAFSPT